MYHDFFLHIAHNGERMNSVIAWDIFLLFKKSISWHQIGVLWLQSCRIT